MIVAVEETRLHVVVGDDVDQLDMLVKFPPRDWLRVFVCTSTVQRNVRTPYS